MGSTGRPEPTITEGTDGANTAETAQIERQSPRISRPAALSDRLPIPLLFPLLAFAAAWALILVAWQVANAIYRVPWAWGKYFLYQDGSTYNWLAIHGYAARTAFPRRQLRPLTSRCSRWWSRPSPT